jgi:hypothetical protein
MEIIIKDLFAKYNWEEIEPVLFRLYPIPERSVAEYKEAYLKFTVTVPVKTSMRIVIEEYDDTDVGKWYWLFGKNGTLVKEIPQFQNENAYQQLKDRWESEQGYALSYTSWAEMAGMIIDPNTLSSFDEKDIVVHVLMEITFRWRTDDEDVKVLKEFEAIANGQEQNIVHKEMMGKSGHRQVWTGKDKANCFYTLYWKDIVIVEQGIVVDGNKEGIWTYWDRSGKVENQVRYWCDREMEPWIQV